VRAVAGSLDDPFRVVELDRDASGALPGEMMSQSLTGGRRVVRVREAGDAAAGPMQRALAGGGTALAVLEAGALTTRSKLRQTAEQAADAVAIACYKLQGNAAADAVRSVLRDLSVAIDADALAWLAESASGDQALLRQEAEKLGLLVGAGGRADLAAAMLSAGDAGGLSLDDALYAATAGDVARADRALETALAEGATPVGVVRAALMHVQRLLQARLLIDGGMAAADAGKRLRPPVFQSRDSAFARAMSVHGSAALSAVAQHLTETELACKRTGAPAEMLVRATILTVARRAAATAQRR
jgi:DNA polymerase-3 subunit delta